MIKTSLMVCVMMMGISVSAQRKGYLPQGENQERYKEISGRYGSNDGICLFEDGTFMLYGYATAVFGHYGFEKDYLLFYTDKQDLFEIYAHQDPSLGAGTKMAFVGFEDGNTYVKFDKDSVQQVFNDDANCFSSPFVYEKNTFPRSISLYAAENSQDDSLASWNYQNDKGFNNFVLVHNKARREYEDFSGALYKNEDNQLVIQLSNYGGEDGYKKQESDHEWNDIMMMKNEYLTSFKSRDFMLVNKHYGTFERDLSTYRLDKFTNQYMRQDDPDNDAYYEDNVYQDDRILSQFLKQNLMDRVMKGREELVFSDSTIFFSSCTEIEKSYRYKGKVLKKVDDEELKEVVAPLIMTLPVEQTNTGNEKNSKKIHK